MIRKLMLMTIIVALGIVLVSPCVDSDDAVHHDPHHHHFSLPLLQATPSLVANDDRATVLTQLLATVASAKPAISLLRSAPGATVFH
jgi:hypothetical protein